MTQEENTEVKVQEVEEDPTQKLTPAEEAIMNNIVGEEEKQEEVAEPVEAVATEEVKEEIIEKKEDLGAMLAEQMGVTADKIDDDDPEVLKQQLATERRKLQVIEESEKLEGLIAKFPELERGLLEKGVEDLIKGGTYAKLSNMDTDEKLAFLVSTARGNMKDKIDEVSKTNLSTQRANEQIIQTNVKAPAPATSNESLDDLKLRAREGDREAQIQLQSFDPVLDKIGKEYLT